MKTNRAILDRLFAQNESSVTLHFWSKLALGRKLTKSVIRVSDFANTDRYRRFAFDGLFDAIEQINNTGPDSTVHLWLETDYFIGGRREVLLDFFRRLSAKQQHTVGWIVINETLLDVSPKARFDLIEHAHMVQGPTATGRARWFLECSVWRVRH